MSKRARLLLLVALLSSSAALAEGVSEVVPGAATERHLPSDAPLTQWARDPNELATQSGDQLEKREVLAPHVKTMKLKNVVPPIHFESGVADIPPSTVEKLRRVLDGMTHLQNVRLHLVGHADDQPLSSALAGVYGDNAGLSRERAAEVAEFIQRQLMLPPEAIAFEWAGDSQPIASNATPEGRAQNRRVEVEVWYDELETRPATEEVVVPHEIKRLKVCRTETVCKMRYREGQERRARVRNLVAPLRYGDDTVGVPDDFVRQVADALHNLGDKQNVMVKLIGFTDDAPLTGRINTIYGTHLALSTAQAHRVALALQDALHLPSAAVVSEGRGESQPVASNESERGRAANRRVEVEFWHDDPLQELPDEPQPCPDTAGDEVMTRVYDPPWGPIAPLPIEQGQPVIPPGTADDLRRALSEVADKTHPRLRFVGYTANEPLDRRTALVYGDDVGLATDRARRAMEAVRSQLGLPDAQLEHEGRGYVQSSDVVNGGFIQGQTSHVAVEVVYDERVPRDDLDGVDVTPLTRELGPKDPLALNLMRITVDGKPTDDPGRSSADIQRCTDVALEQADIQFRFDDLKAEPRLSVTAKPNSVPVPEPGGAATEASTVRFRMYTNYAHFIERAEVRIFAKGQSLQAEPLGVVPVPSDGVVAWQPPSDPFPAPIRELQYMLRVYDASGRFDETEPQWLWLYHSNAPAPGPAPAPELRAPDGQLAGYGESRIALRNIALGSVGGVQVHGTGVPPAHYVSVAGAPVPIDEAGNFVAEAILPAGLHTVEVAVLDEAGNGDLYLRDFELEKSTWFYVGLADVTLSTNDTSGAEKALQGENAPRDSDSSADGRLAFYVNGKFGEDWGVTASADTREGKMSELFTNFLEKQPESLLRRIDPDYYYPTYGDDSVTQETAPTLGKFFVKLTKAESSAMWGNFRVGYLGNELAQVDRGLYGANLHYQSPSTTKFGEQRLVLDGFGAEPGTLPSREEFLGTGGSLYFLRHQDLLVGSDRVRIEVRDQDSGLVVAVKNLRPVLDYDIDYIQGRIMLTEPLSATADGLQLVRTDGVSGDEAWLVVQYEFSPGVDEIDAWATGGQGQYWFNDWLKVGLTANGNNDGESDSSLYGGDLTLRKTTDTWFKLQAGRSEGLVSTSLFSDDGGFGFAGVPGVDLAQADAEAYRADLNVGLADLFQGAGGRLSLYGQRLGAGYTAPGQTALTDTDQFGGLFKLPLTERLDLSAKADHMKQTDALTTTAAELDLGYKLSDRWSMGGGVRNDDRTNDSPISLATQQEGNRTDAVVQLAYDSLEKWRSYGFVQETLAKSGDRDSNGRVGVGGSYRVSDKLRFDGEVSEGDLGPGAKVGTAYQQSDRTSLYLNYALENERTDNGMFARGANLITGMKTRLSDSTSVQAERRQQTSDQLSGLTNTAGVTLSPTDRWNIGANVDVGTLVNRLTDAQIDRKATGLHLGYGFDKLQLSSGLEYRKDEIEQLTGTTTDRTTWLFRNSFKFQTTPDWRVLGKFNFSDSNSSEGGFFDGGFTEAVLGFAYRPVTNDRLNVLGKYTYFYNLPATDQFTLIEDVNDQYVQQSHVVSLDLSYDLTASWSIGGKYAYRLGQLSLDRENPDFFRNDAHLYVLRTDWRFLKNYEGSLEGRLLDLPDAGDRRTGAVLTIYRYVGDHLKIGIGYNFTDYSDDLTDLSYDDRGVFLNLVGSM